MVLGLLLSEMSDDEKAIFNEQSTNNYLEYIFSSSQFKKLSEKLENGQELDNRDWDFILKKLYLVSTKSYFDEEDIDWKDRVLILFCKVGIKLFGNGTRLYNECYKPGELYRNIEREKEINADLFQSLVFVLESEEEADLKVLLRQHTEAAIFRDCMDYFYQSYENSSSGELLGKEKLALQSLNTSFERGKELVKHYRVLP